MKWNIKALISMTLALVLVIGCIGMVSVADPANAEELFTGHDKYLEMTVKFPANPAGSANAGEYYPIALWLPNTITFKPGDQLVYDVWMSHDVGGFGTIDLCMGSLAMHDLPVKDEDGVLVHPTWKIAGAYKNWKTRRITLPDAYSQSTFSSGGTGPAVVFPVQLPFSPKELAGETVTVKFDNIRIEHADGTVSVMIYQESESIYNSYLAPTLTGYPDVKYQIRNGYSSGSDLVDDDILQMVVDIPAGATNPNGMQLYAKVFEYYAFRDAELRLNPGDRLVYDVRILNDIGGIGGVEFVATHGQNSPFMRDRLKDSAGVNAHPSANIAGYAYNQWWTRSITLDNTYVAAVNGDNQDLYLAVELTANQVAALAGQKLIIQYDNIRIEHADRTGKDAIKHVIFSSEENLLETSFMFGLAGAVQVPNSAGTGTTVRNVGLNISVVDEAHAEQAPAATGSLTYGITLKDNIAMNFNITIQNEHKANTTVALTVGEKTTTYTANQGKLLAGNVYQFSAELASAQMTEPVKVEVKVGNAVKLSKAYTVQQYVDEYLKAKPDTSSELRQLLGEMLNYGAMSQIYFKHNLDNLANKNVGVAVAQTEIPATPMQEAKISGAVAGLTYQGSTLVFENRLALRFYFQPEAGKSMSDFAFKLNGKKYTDFQTSDKGTYLEVVSILPNAFGQEHVVIADTVSGTNNPLTIEYSPMAYMCRMYQKSGDAKLQDLLKAMYNYFLAAEAYEGEFVANSGNMLTAG